MFFLKFCDGQSTNKGDCVKSKVVSVHDVKPYGKYTYSSTHLTVALDKMSGQLHILAALHQRKLLWAAWLCLHPTR